MTERSETLAFVFWHRPGDGVSPSEYELGLSKFHGSLARGRPPGFQRSASYRLSALPWTPETPWPVAYVDWYLLDDWAALGRLNHAAIRAPHDRSHDAVASRSSHGHGSLYQLRSGVPDPDGVRFEYWAPKPAGTRSDEFAGQLDRWTPSEGSSVWQRLLALGPAMEFCRRARHPSPSADPGTRRLELRPVPFG